MHCRICNGINLVWDSGKGKWWEGEGVYWSAPYVDGGVYCDCPDEELEAELEARKEGVDNYLNVC